MNKKREKNEKREGKRKTIGQLIKTVVSDMQSPENSGNWFGLFWVPELWAYQWLWEESREPLVAAEVKPEEKK